MKLKDYQTDTLAVLRRFLEEARVAGPKNAYDAVTSEPEQTKRLGRYRTDYRPLEALPGSPYVCLRLPTGGGKTLLGAHAIAVARDAWIEKDYPLVLWLVPTNTIRLQTAEALKNPRHPYRQALDAQFGGRVRVFDIVDFTTLRPHDLRDNACIVVGTIQTLRVGNTEGRKVYAHNENMEPHFSTIPRTTKGLEQRDGSSETAGDPKFSFANLLHVRRPLMIVDEAHGAVTGLTRDMQARVNPCAIIEFTATPRFNSNILHSVTAQELKSAEMIKLPIILAEHDSWQNAVNGAIRDRAALELAAKGEADYIRPIVLFQAQPRNQEVTVEVLKKHLIEAEQIAPERIAVATGDQRDLDGINLFDDACPIDFVITVEALKEGWDCSFAYVFCTVSRIQNATDVEQLLGRVLRMPYATKRKDDALNRAYAHVAEPTFTAAASALVDKLVNMGFEDHEAEEIVEPAQGHFDSTGLFAPRERPKPVFRHVVSPSSDGLESLAGIASSSGVAITSTSDGRVEIAVTGRIAPEVEQAVVFALPETERSGFSEAVRRYRHEIEALLSPAEQGQSFRAPRLLAQVQGELEFADIDVFMEHHDWSLVDHPARLDESAFAIRETSRSFEIDVDGARIAYAFASEDDQLPIEIDVEGWTPQNLVVWLDRQLRQSDVSQTDLVRWVSDCVTHLHGVRKISVAALMRAKFILARKLNERIATARRAEQEKVYQRSLFGPDAKVEVSFDNGFEFREGMYADVRKQPKGRWKPKRHFLGADNLPAFDGAVEGEEFKCAQAIDSLRDIDFWLRNVARHPASFRLPVAGGFFYPDFVVKLSDGRLLVVEYKGARWAGAGDAETNGKRAIGRLWEQRGGGLFVVVEKELNGRGMQGQLMDKLAAS